MTEAAQPPMIGRYELITRLATGGMAELFLARERGIAGLERLVVIKRILPQLADQRSFIDMFLREARLVARLNHPNVVQIYELGEEEGTYYIAMEYIHGSTVRELQVLGDNAEEPFPISVAVAIVQRGLRGLHAAHELKDLDGKPLGLVHRDVSPHNLMVTSQGHVKLLDFGVAKATSGVESTYSGNLKGKFAYMSPEQCLRDPLDRRSDIFSMGICLWEMVTGERLFKRKNELEMMQAVVSEDTPRPAEVSERVPSALEAVVMKALSPRRDDRYPTADAMRRALAECVDELGLNVGEDHIGRYVGRIAGEQLELRDETLQSALERSLSSDERQGLLHVTGSSSRTGNSKPQTINQELLEELRESRREAGYEDSFSSADGQAAVPSAETAETVVSKFQEEEAEPSDVDRPASDVSPPTGNGTELEERIAALEEASRVGPAPSSEPGSRRWWIALLALLLVAGAAVAYVTFFADSATDGSDTVLLGDPLRIAWAPVVDTEILRKEVQPLRDYLEKEVGRPMPITITDSYLQSSEMLREGEVSFAVLPPLMYVRTKRAESGIEPIAIKVFDGAKASDGLLLVRHESKIRELDDLEGKTFCFSDRNSTTGNFLPRAYIRRQGHDPESFIGETRWSGDHLQVIRDLLEGRCDAGATYSGAFISADALDLPVGQLRTFAITGNVPQESLIAGPDVSGVVKRKVRRALLRFDPREDLGVEKLGETQRITSFAPVSDDDYASLRSAIEANEKLAGKDDSTKQTDAGNERQDASSDVD